MQKKENLHIQPESYIQRLGDLTSLNNHEPPIGVGGGRFFIDIPQNVTLVDPSSPHDPYVYTFKNAADSEFNYTGISALLMVTENDEGFVEVVTYSTSADEGTKLHLWFPDDRNPSVILEVVNSVRQLTITSSLDPPVHQPSKNHRPYRRICSNPDARIVQWELVGSSGNVIQDPISGAMLSDSGADDYHLYLSFAHHHHED